MYISPPKDWWDAGDPSLPIRYVTELGTVPALSVRCDGAKCGKIKRESQLRETGYRMVTGGSSERLPVGL